MIFMLEANVDTSGYTVPESHVVETNEERLWHQRFFHINNDAIRKTFQLKRVTVYECIHIHIQILM